MGFYVRVVYVCECGPNDSSAFCRYIKWKYLLLLWDVEEDMEG